MNEIMANIIATSGEAYWLRLAARQGYRGATGERLAQRADALFPLGMDLQMACETITNLAEELGLPLPEKA